MSKVRMKVQRFIGAFDVRCAKRTEKCGKDKCCPPQRHAGPVPYDTLQKQHPKAIRPEFRFELHACLEEADLEPPLDHVEDVMCFISA